MAAINQEPLALGRFDQDGLAYPDHGPIRLMTERAV
jgi:hypothetical protein